MRACVRACMRAASQSEAFGTAGLGGARRYARDGSLLACSRLDALWYSLTRGPVPPQYLTCCCMSCTKDSIGLPASKRTVLIRRIRPWAAFTVRHTLRTPEVQRHSNGTTRTFGTQGVCWGLKCKLGTSGSAGYASLPTVPVEYTSTEPRGAS